MIAEFTPSPKPIGPWSSAPALRMTRRRDALRVLLERYQPALRSYLLNVRRMTADAADELLQSFIADRILEHELVRMADQRLGRFRALLLASLRNFGNIHYRAEKVRSTKPLPADVAMKSTESVDASVEAAQRGN